jgi:hypothetical protein
MNSSTSSLRTAWEKSQRPWCRVIFFSIRLPLEFSQHARALLARRRRLAATAARCLQNSLPMLVKAVNPLRECFPAPTRVLPRCCPCGSRCHCQQGFRSFYRIQALTRGYHDSCQLCQLFSLPFSEFFFSWSSHWCVLFASFPLRFPFPFSLCNPLAS